MRSRLFSALAASLMVVAAHAADKDRNSASEPMTAPPRMALVEGGRFPLGVTTDQLKEFTDKMLGKGRKPKELMRRSVISRRDQSVDVAPFFIDINEVTNAEYKIFVDATGAKVPSNWTDGVIPPGKEMYPVAFVNFSEAQAYARWAGKRLPTEIEWEKAARGTDGRWYPWGNDWKDEGFCKNALQPPAGKISVGTYPAGVSPFQLNDMAGNVWEWTTTYIAPYPGNDNDSEFNRARGYVIRGGSFMNSTHELASFIRNSAEGQHAFEAVGFRCVKGMTTGSDATGYAIELIKSQLPAGSGIDPSKAVGRESVTLQEATGFVTSARTFALAPAANTTFATKQALDNEARKSGGFVALAVLTTDVATSEPALPAGNYAILYQMGDPRAARREEKAKEGDKAKDAKPEAGEAGEAGEDEEKEKEADPEDSAKFAPYDRIIFVDQSGATVAEIKEPLVESVSSASSSIQYIKDVPPVGKTSGTGGGNGFQATICLSPKFGNRSLSVPLLFKIADNVSEWR
jgi:formylglycine-generating enzyme required for sulfatase activity